MAWAQVFGIQRGYIANVDGQIVHTMADHHHEGQGLDADHFVDFVPHSHDDATCAGHSHSHGDDADCNEDGSGEEKRHDPVKLDLKLHVTSSLVLSFDLVATPQLSAAFPQFYNLGEKLSETYELRVERGPPTSVMVAECKVLLI